ncbi:MAG: preprotein translocase subunit SecY, partial [Phycisphaerae bacterium]|nr:preprotein translocase subunit SecY [Phycisphaerae bacterium]
MLRTIFNIFKVPELRRKLLFTVMILAVCRIGFFVPLPGTHPQVIAELMKDDVPSTEDGESSGAAGYLDFIAAITGGRFGPFIFALGIMPYISASIIIQLLTTAVPALERLSKEGEPGRRKISQYTRYLAVPLCLIQAALIIKASYYVPGAAQSGWCGDVNQTLYYVTALASVTAGTIFLMWLGEQIDEFGIGNGISLIIMVGIVSRLPAVVVMLRDQATLEFFAETGTGKLGLGQLVVLLAMFVTIVLAVVLITQGQRRIPIQQAKQMRGRRMYGGQRQYLPLRVNQAGVIPIIFAVSLMFLPTFLLRYLSRTVDNSALSAVASSVMNQG